MTRNDNGSRRWLVLRLEAPLIAFGGVTIDHLGVIRDFPALSMLTGLLANALGYERTERDRHQALQDRLVFAARREVEAYHGVLLDTQNVQDLHNEKRAWTTRGKPEERGGGSLHNVHRRERHYHPDALVAMVLTLEPSEEAPTLEDLVVALERPARPLFIGRKPCLPVTPLLERQNDGGPFLEAETAHGALARLPRLRHTGASAPEASDEHNNGDILLRAIWPATEGPTEGPGVDRTIALADRRNWLSGLHGGTREVVEGSIAVVKEVLP